MIELFVHVQLSVLRYEHQQRLSHVSEFYLAILYLTSLLNQPAKPAIKTDAPPSCVSVSSKTLSMYITTPINERGLII